jgi:hypothetical protein
MIIREHRFSFNHVRHVPGGVLDQTFTPSASTRSAMPRSACCAARFFGADDHHQWLGLLTGRRMVECRATGAGKSVYCQGEARQVGRHRYFCANPDLTYGALNNQKMICAG